jgi:hypothetical protein
MNHPLNEEGETIRRIAGGATLTLRQRSHWNEVH